MKSYRIVLMCLSAFSMAGTAATLTSVTITPGKAMLYPTETQQYGASCHYSDHADDDCTAAGGVNWVVTNPNGLASINSSGLLTAATHTSSSTGNSAYVEARLTGSVVYGYSYLGVLPTAGDAINHINITPSAAVTVPAGVGMWSSAQIVSNAGVVINAPAQRIVNWTSSDPSVATVDWEGHVTALAPGTATLTGTLRSVSKNFTLTVVPAVPNPSPKTWYVRPDGGSRYDATGNPTGRCNGLSDLPDPGSGTNQPCAYSNPKWLWITGPSTNTTRWSIAGGDTVIIRQNPNGVGNTPSGVCNNGSYDCGYDVGAKDWAHFASTGFDGCAGLQYSCMNPPIPSGAPTQHTRILGENFASCGAASAKTTLYGTVANNAVLNLSGTSYVDVACIGVSDRTGCVRSGNSGQYICQDGVDPRPSISGILVDPATTDISLTDIDAHGVSSGWLGMAGDHITLTRARFGGNSSAGMNFDPGNGYTQGGGMTADRLLVEWSGCSEQYPVVNALPFDNCRGQNTGGYGDGLGTPDTGGIWSIDHSTFRFNTQDGLDLLHVSLPGGSSFSVTNSIGYANMGQQFKLGQSNNMIFQNNQIIGDCSRMSWPVPGTPSSYNSPFYLSVTAASWSGGTATITIGTNSPPWYAGGTIQVGQAIAIVGAIPSAYNGSYIITAVTPTTVSYALASDPGTYSGGGIVVGSDNCRANGTAVAVGVTPHSVFQIQNNTWAGPDNIHLELECSLSDTIGDCTGARIQLQNNIMRGYYGIGRKSYSTGVYMGNGAALGPIFTGTRGYNLFYNLKSGMETDCNKGYPGEICVDPTFFGEVIDAAWNGVNDQTLFDSSDLRLSGSSPAIGGGVSIAGLTSDYAGITRPQPPAIGAYEPQGLLSLSPASLSFACTLGGPVPGSKTLAASAVNTTLDNCSAGNTQTWLAVSPMSGSATGNFTASVSCSGLSAGSYTDTISVASTTAGMINSPQTAGVSLTVYPAVTVTTAIPLPNGSPGASYSRQLTATGGVAPYTWTRIAGNLCPGLSLSSGGLISGTPRPGTCSFTVQVADTLGGSGTISVALTFNAPAGALTSGARVSGVVIR